MLDVHLPESLERRLSLLAQETGKSENFYVQEALEAFLSEYEDIYKAVSEYERDKAKGTLVTYSLEDLKKMHDLE
jgi:RHH-type rel operon transcriptional repressor/antitoxin RelB